jgi:hypothetical protein
MNDNTNEKDNTIGAFKQAVDKGTEAQLAFMRQLTHIQQDAMHNFFSILQGLTYNNAMFKTTVQSGGRISIPEAERQALNIEDGDLVQVIIIPIERKGKAS